MISARNELRALCYFESSARILNFVSKQFKIFTYFNEKYTLIVLKTLRIKHILIIKKVIL